METWRDPSRKPTGRRSRGFSLVEAMIAISLLAGGVIVVMRLTSVSQKAQKTVEQSAELTQLQASVDQLLSSPEACKANLQGLVFDPTKLDPQGNLDDSYLQAQAMDLSWPVKSGATLAKGALFLKAGDATAGKFAGWTVDRLGLRVKAPLSIAAGTYLLSVETQLTKQVATLGSQTVRRASIPVTVSTAASGANRSISSCSGQGSTSGKGLVSTIQDSDGAIYTAFVIPPGNSKTWTMSLAQADLVRGSLRVTHFTGSANFDWNPDFTFDKSTGDFKYSMNGYHWAKSGSFNVNDTWRVFATDVGTAGNDGATTAAYPSAPASQPYQKAEVRYDTATSVLTLKFTAVTYGASNYNFVADLYR